MKNWSIIISVFVVPLLLFFFLSANDSVSTEVATSDAMLASNEHYVIKFSTPMCMDCKRLEGPMKVMQEKYKDKVIFQSYNAADGSPKVQNMVKTYNVKVVPTTVFLNTKTKRQKVIEGYMDERFIDREIRAIIRG